MTAPTLHIPQAVVVRGTGGPRLVGRSPGISFELEEAILGTAVRFGQRPPNTPCPHAVFACPLGPDHVGVAQVADLLGEGSDPPLRFRFLVFVRRQYNRDGYRYLADPFAVADRFPADPAAAGDLPALEWVIAGPPPRPAGEVREVLRTGDGPLLLGAAQALIDGGRLAVVRTAPDPGFVRGVWQLLPDKVRAELWPASFAFSAELGFDLAALPSPPPAGFITEEQAKDYPEGRYELALQTAAEAGDQAELDRLFARKTSKEVLRLALGMVAAALLLAAVMKFL